MEAFLSMLLVKAPALVILPWLMGALRGILKPTFSYLHQVLGAVKADKLDAQVTIIEQSTAVKWLYYILDWFASIKIATPSVIVAAPTVVGLMPVQAAATVTTTVTTASVTQEAVDHAIEEAKK